MFKSIGVNITIIIRFLCVTLLVLAALMSFTGLVGYLYNEPESGKFFIIAGLIIIISLIGFKAFPKILDNKIRIKDSFLIIVSLYIIVPLFGMLPFLFASPINSFTNAIFESYAGFTTTGFSTLVEYGDVPKTIILWRSAIQWLGGMGIIVFIIALFPAYGTGHSKNFFSDIFDIDTQPMHHRFATTAKLVWMIYIIYSLLGVIALYLAGQDIFDAVIYSAASVSTGGGVPVNGNLTDLSIRVKSIIMILMFISSLNYVVFFKSFGKIKLRLGEENRVYLLLLVVFIILISITGIYYLGYSNILLFESVFNTVSFISTTGFYSSEVFSANVLFIWFLLFVLLFIGSSTGSSGGGINIYRVVILAKMLMNYIKQNLHPGLLRSIRFDKKIINEIQQHRVIAFFVLYILVFISGAFILTIFGYNLENAFSLCAASISNTGPGVFLLDDYFSFSDLNLGAKYTVMALMVVGRIELFPFLIIISGSFWTK